MTSEYDCGCLRIQTSYGVRVGDEWDGMRVVARDLSTRTTTWSRINCPECGGSGKRKMVEAGESRNVFDERNATTALAEIRKRLGVGEMAPFAEVVQAIEGLKRNQAERFPQHALGESLFTFDAWLDRAARRPDYEGAKGAINEARAKVRETFAALLRANEACGEARENYWEATAAKPEAECESGLRFDVQEVDE